MQDSIDCTIINGGDREFHPSITHFMQANGIEMNMSAAVFVNESALPGIEMDAKRMYLRNGRHLTNAEIGVALANRKAQQSLISSTRKWHMVLEDDAIIDDEQLLLNQINEIVRNKTTDPTIYLLYHHLKKRHDPKTLGLFHKYGSIPSYTVAYVANIPALKLLVRAQSPLFSVSDWPICTHVADYHLAKSSSIKHGSESGHFQSYVGSPLRNVIGMRKWKWVFGKYLFCSGLSMTERIHNHFCFVIWPRIYKFIIS